MTKREIRHVKIRIHDSLVMAYNTDDKEVREYYLTLAFGKYTVLNEFGYMDIDELKADREKLKEIYEK